MKKKICVITGSRAEYGLLHPLLDKISSQRQFQLQIIAGGAHLSKEFGLTYREIEKDGFRIDEKVKMFLSSDTRTAMAKAIGMGIGGFTDALNRLKPDLTILLGDRFEILSAAIAAFVYGVPIAHIHGGELTEGAIDDAFRHSISKMSFLHFTATEEYRKRVIQLGEDPGKVFNVGALGVDNIKNLKFPQKEEVEKELRFKLAEGTILVTFHPVTLEFNASARQFRELLSALSSFKKMRIIFTKPNADAGGIIIARLIDDYVRINSDRAVAFVSLGRLRYLSALKYVDAVVGNSSSGIIETPSFGKPSVNIGDRQRGRIRAKSVIDCGPQREDIKKAIIKASSREFKQFCKTVRNPYGGGHSAEKICEIIKENIYSINNLKKFFFDI